MARAAAGTTQWLARGEHEIPPGMAWLTPREAQRADTLRFTKRRTEFLLRRLVGKHAVAETVGGDLGPQLDQAAMARIEVTNHPTGAPYVLVDDVPLGIDVSLTDRAGWAICVVGADLARVGCDLEVVETRSAGFLTDFLTDREQRMVGDLDPAVRDAAANLVWSAKESALKVLRTGLRRDTRTVDVVLDEEHLTRLHDDRPGDWSPMRIDATEGGSMPGWWRRDGSFLFTVAADCPFDPPRMLEASSELRHAEPVHSWVRRPLVD